MTTDKHQRYQTSYTAPCNGVVSQGAQFRGLWVFTDHTRKSKRKTNALTIFAFRLQYMQVTYPPDEPRLFWLQEKPEDLQIKPHAGIKMAQGLVSLVYICGMTYVCCIQMTFCIIIV